MAKSSRLGSLLFLLLATQPLTAQSWHIVSKTAANPSGMRPFGFAYELRNGSWDITSYNSSTCLPGVPNYCPPSDGCTNIGLKTIYGGVGSTGLFGGPDISYFNFGVSLVGKVLYNPGHTFYNPRDGLNYTFRMYLASQYYGQSCGTDGEGTAYSQNGTTWVEGPKAAMLPGGPPPAPDFWCTYWPCGSGGNTAVEIFTPFIWFADGNYYAATWLFNPANNYSGCVNETDLCYPTNPAFEGTGAYVLQSSDGLTWSRYNVSNGDFGRLSRSGIDTTSPCYHAAWLINIDLAYDPVGQDFYMTRSYASNYPGSGHGCSPAKLPDHVQLYKTHLSGGLFYGPWQLLIDLGCSNMGYQVDSATILHDGKGNVIKGSGGSVTLLVNMTGGGTYWGNACAVSPNPLYRVVVSP